MDTHIDQLSQIAATIDATLGSSFMAQARELFLLGQENLREGLLEKALEVYL
jgi:hypothetical protein